MRLSGKTRGVLAFWAFLVLAFAAYGSLLPFRLRGVGFDEALIRFANIEYLDLGAPNRADWIANILLYVPSAFLLTGAFAGTRRNALSRAAGVLCAAVICIGIAVLIEFLQIFIFPRTVSLNDLLAESIGVALGIGLWFTTSVPMVDLVRKLKLGGAAAIEGGLWAYIALYGLYALFPFDFVVSERELAVRLDRLLSGGGTVEPRPLIDMSRMVWVISSILAAAPIGALAKLRAPQVTGAALLFIGAVVGLVVETVQIFIFSSQVHLVTPVLVALGLCVGAFATETAGRYPIWRWRETARFVGLAMIAPVLCVLIVLYRIIGGPYLSVSEALSSLQTVSYWPFYYHYYVSEMRALSSLVEIGALYFAFGAAIWAASGAPLHKHVRALAILGGLLALVLETARAFKPELHPDYTNVLIAMTASGVAGVILPVLFEGFSEATAAPRVLVPDRLRSASRNL